MGHWYDHRPDPLPFVFLGFFATRWPDAVQWLGLGLRGAVILLAAAGQLGVQEPWLAAIVLSILFGLPLAISVFGTRTIIGDDRLVGLLPFWIGLLHLLAWSIISNLLACSSAIPTFLTIVLLPGWVLLRFRQDAE